MVNIEIKTSAFEADYPADAIEHQFSFLGSSWSFLGGSPL